MKSRDRRRATGVAAGDEAAKLPSNLVGRAIFPENVIARSLVTTQSHDIGRVLRFARNDGRLFDKTRERFERA